MKNIDILNVRKKELVDIREVSVDYSLPKEERIKSFIEQIQNPYCFLCNGTVVKVVFEDNEHTVEERMIQYFRGKMIST